MQLWLLLQLPSIQKFWLYSSYPALQNPAQKIKKKLSEECVCLRTVQAHDSLTLFKCNVNVISCRQTNFLIDQAVKFQGHASNLVWIFEDSDLAYETFATKFVRIAVR